MWVGKEIIYTYKNDNYNWNPITSFSNHTAILASLDDNKFTSSLDWLEIRDLSTRVLQMKSTVDGMQPPNPMLTNAQIMFLYEICVIT